MYRLFFVGILALYLLPSNLSSQYDSLVIAKPYFLDDVQPLEIVQIDFREESTLVHFTLTNYSALGSYYQLSRDFILSDKETNLYYKLLNSYNLPLDNVNEFGYLEDYGEELNFTLEFEKVPENLTLFDLIEDREDDNSIIIRGIKIEKSSKREGFLDLNSFLNSTPLKRINYYYSEGEIVQYQHDPKGLNLAAAIEIDKTYGKYFQVDLSIQNLTGRYITIIPEEIRAYYVDEFGKDFINWTNVLSHEKYMRKVKNRQSWNSIFISFMEGAAASTAGYSNTTAYTKSFGYNGARYTSGNSISTSETYDASAAYLAQQQAKNNVSNLVENQYQVRNTLNEGYLKRNTLTNETEYIGFINIPYSKKIKVLKVMIPIDGDEYEFIFQI
ncbi:hypothetical protein [Robiginitalea sp. IMCC43444]|uniref:hypothetical protein n=1 Tax=Robiginitalea sp. IMCC43444 TaxID=3459121 RepID=UPI0040423EE3